MKRAWGLVKKSGFSISEALRKAWREAKTLKKKFDGSAKILKDGYSGESDSNFLNFNLWQKYGKKRIYINDYKGRTIGYLENDSYTEYDTQGNRESEIQGAIAKFRESYEF